MCDANGVPCVIAASKPGAGPSAKEPETVAARECGADREKPARCDAAAATTGGSREVDGSSVCERLVEADVDVEVDSVVRELEGRIVEVRRDETMREGKEGEEKYDCVR